MIRLADADKAFDKMQCPSTLKALSELTIEGNLVNLTKIVYKNPIANIKLND